MGLKFLKKRPARGGSVSRCASGIIGGEKFDGIGLFFLHRIGLIYLYAPELGNLETALDYFTRAAKICAIESDPDASRLE